MGFGKISGVRLHARDKVLPCPGVTLFDLMTKIVGLGEISHGMIGETYGEEWDLEKFQRKD